MIVTLQNLGPIDRVTIDLSKPFTILCGLNSTGKTYAAYVIYYILRYFPSTIASRLRSFEKLEEETSIPISLEDIMEWKSTVETDVKNSLSKIFGIPSREAEKIFARFSAEINLGENPLSVFTKHRDRGQLAIGSHKILKWDKPTDSSDIILTPLEDIDFMQKDVEFPAVASMIVYKIIRDSFLGTDEMARMLTVERNSIYTFKAELAVNRLKFVEEMQSDGDETIVRRAPRYPKAVADSLRTAADLENITKQDSGFPALAEILESDVLKGSVSLGENGEVLFTSIDNPEVKLRIQMSSSLVKTLSSLDIYLRHVASKGEYLIIDEPEMNLHPELQCVLAHIFARMANAGIRLIISTHSDYILREINNLVMAYSLKEKGDSSVYAQFDINDNIVLSPEMLQPILFSLDDNGRSTGSNIDINDYGFHVGTIDETIDNQNERTIILSDTLDTYLAEE